MAVAFGPTSCSSVLVPKSKLLHSPEAQDGFVSKLSLHGGKNIALRAEKPYRARQRLSERTMLASVMTINKKGSTPGGVTKEGYYKFCALSRFFYLLNKTAEVCV